MVTPLPTMNPLAGIQGWVDPRRQALLGLASGLVSGNDWGQGLGRGFAMAAEGRKADDAYATAKKEEAERAKQLNYTIQAFQKAGRQDLVDMANAGMMGEAWRQYSAGPADSLKTVGGHLYDTDTREWISPPQTTEMGKPPSGYQFTERGLEPIPGGPADPNNPLNNRRSGSMNATTQKELFEADEAIQAGAAVSQALDRALELNETAWEGPAADLGTQAGALFGDANSVNTQELKNLVTAQALDQLKATFGAMPTEGERKILLEIQGSVTQSREVRKRIFERAKAAVERRVRYNQQKASGLRSGAYFEEGYDAAPVPEADLDTLLEKYR